MKKTELNARKILLPYLIILLVLCSAMQLLIAARGSQIDGVSQALLVSVALYYAYFNAIKHRALSKIRFGKLVAHSVGYVIVNVSFFAHAFILYVSGNPVIRGNSTDFPINSGWFGVLFGMATFWGIGLIIHSIASVALRGYEEINA